MTVIDRYLIRRFLFSLMTFIVSFIGLFIVIDGFGNLEEFIDLGQTEGGLLSVLFEYYGARSLTFIDQLSGVLTLIAAMFTLAAIERHNEVTALMAAGISKTRVVMPLIAMVVVVSLLATASREWAIPAVKHKLTRNAQNWRGTSAQNLQAPGYDKQTNILLNGKASYAAERRIAEPSFVLPGSLRSFGTRLKAKNAHYMKATETTEAGYLLKGVFQPKEIDTLATASVNGRAILLTNRDNPWIKPGECFVASNISFEQLSSGKGSRTFASTGSLISSLRNPSLNYGTDVRVTIHGRIVKPLLDVLLLFLGLPLVLTQEKRNVFVAIGTCMLVVAMFYIVTIICQALGNKNYLISPALAAWLPLIIFTPFAVWLGDRLYR